MNKSIKVVVIAVALLIAISIGGLMIYNQVAKEDIDVTQTNTNKNMEEKSAISESLSYEESDNENSEKIVTPGKMNDDLALEIGSYNLYYKWLLGNDYLAAQRLSADMESGKFYEQFGVTQVEYENYVLENFTIGDFQEQTIERAKEKWGAEKITL